MLITRPSDAFYVIYLIGKPLLIDIKRHRDIYRLSATAEYVDISDLITSTYGIDISDIISLAIMPPTWRPRYAKMLFTMSRRRNGMCERKNKWEKGTSHFMPGARPDLFDESDARNFIYIVEKVGRRVLASESRISIEEIGVIIKSTVVQCERGLLRRMTS